MCERRRTTLRRVTRSPQGELEERLDSDRVNLRLSLPCTIRSLRNVREEEVGEQRWVRVNVSNAASRRYTPGCWSVLTTLRRVLSFFRSRLKVEMVGWAIPVPKIDTGGERRWLNPRVKQAWFSLSGSDKSVTFCSFRWEISVNSWTVLSGKCL